MPKRILHKVIFRSRNNFGKERGDPPQLDSDDGNKYVAYFENGCREQFIFVYEYLSHTGTLWSSIKGWENPIPIMNGKAQNAGLGRSEKTWLATCWNVATTVDQRREHHRLLLAEQQIVSSPNEAIVPPQEEIVSQMGRLYDGLAQRGLAPDCSRSEFTYGWAGLIELTAKLEAKYKAK